MIRDEKGNEYDSFQRLDEYAREKVELAQRFILSAFERAQIAESSAKSLISALADRANTWDQAFDHFDQVFKDLAHTIKHKDYYDAIDRYEKGTAMLEQEQRPAIQAKYRARLNELAIEIERLNPKGEIA